jgi:uncharacterized protein YhaN
VTVTALRFKKLEIVRLAGIPRGSGFALDGLSADINLIHGPNGVGKSLTGQSLLALIWPAVTTLERPTVTGIWTLAENSWSVDLDAGHPTWRCDGIACDPPSLPSAESRGHHWLGLRELLTDDGPDAAATSTFAERIALELLGGFDLDEAAQSLRASPRPPQPRKVRKDFEDARSGLDEARTCERELHAKSETLDTLIAQCESAKEADEERRRLDRALSHRDAVDDVRRLERELSEFDEMLDRLSGDEQDRLDGLRKRLLDSERNGVSAEQELEKADRAKADTGFADGTVPNEVLEAATQDVNLVSECQREVRQSKADLEEATQELESRAELVASSVSTETLGSMGVTPSEEMAQYARDLVAHRTQAVRVKARDREAAEVEKRLQEEAELAGVGSADHVRRGLDALSRWLGSSSQSAVSTSGWLVTLVAAAGIIALLLLALVALHHWGWALGMIAVAVLVWLARPKQVSTSGTDDRSTHQRDYEVLQLPKPDSWTTDAVQSVWFSLTETWARLEELKSASQRLEGERAEIAELRREVDSAEERLQRTRLTLEATLGFAIDDERSDWLQVIGEHLQAWQSARVRVDSLTAKLNEQQKALDGALASFNNRVAQYMERPAGDPSAAGGVLESIKQRAQEHREATIQAQGAKQDLERAQSDSESLGEDINTLLANFGLDENSERVLSQWLEQLERYRETKRELGGARVRQEIIAAEVGKEHPSLEHDRARIESDRDAAQREAERLSEIEREIGAIRREIDNAKADHQVEDARWRVDETKAILAKELQDAEQKVASHAVIEWLREEATDRTQPAVLRHASALFQRITHGRYELRVEEASGGPTFVAWDTQHEIQKSLNELSAGERVQLLVSVRLGFLEHEESGVRLPLILDETLGTTDDERARAIIDTVVEICRTGRQVFYFTAQPDEVGKWLGRLKGVEDIELKVADLARIRGLAEADGVPLVIDRPSQAALPDPTGFSREEYGQALSVPGLDPRRPVGMVHLWHLIDEPSLLHSLVKKNIYCWGPFEALVVKGIVRIEGLDENTIGVVAARARAVRSAFSAWHIGRGKSVDRLVLEASSAVSGAFVNRLVELAASVGGDALQLIELLKDGQVSRWRSTNTEALNEYLEEQGYIDYERRMTRDEIHHRSLEETAREHAGVDLGDDWLNRMVAGLPVEQDRIEDEASE